MAIVNEEIKGTESVNDELTNSKKGYTRMVGLTGNDTYIINNFSTSFTEIDDADGLDFYNETGLSPDVNSNGIPTKYFGEDTIQINNIKTNDLTLFFDYSIGDKNENPESMPADELYIIKKGSLSSAINTTLKGGLLQNNAVLISSQFGDTNNGGSQMSAASIEHLKVVDTKTGITKIVDMEKTMEAIQPELKALLEEIKEKKLTTIDMETKNEVPVLSIFQLLASKHTAYKNKAINIYKNQLVHTEIIGSENNDKIVGDKADEIITGGLGNDTITGGTGLNTINYTFGALDSNGNDVINLTKGENFVLNIDGANISELKFKYANNNKDLVIYKSETESITLKNFAYKDVTNNSTKKTENTSSVIITDGTDEIDLRKDFYIKGEDNKIKTDKNYTGTWLNEEIDASLAALTKKVKVGKKYQNVPKEFTDKGLSLNGGSGNDSIVGSRYSDTIKGGNGDDIIDGGTGNDNITGGTGKNTINYTKGDGNDVINLTKGENFTLSLEDVTDIENVKFEFVKNDLRIYADKTNKDEYITIKNFVAKDVTNNSNAKKGIEDTSSVELKIGSETYDLRNLVDSDNFPYYYEIDTNKSYSGSWLGEYIDGQYYRRYTDKAQTIVDTDYTKKGITLDGKGGNDAIDGSMYSDVIKGGDGDDTLYGERGNDIITAGTGKNTIYVCEDEGNDVINLTKGENFTLSLEDVTDISKVGFEFVNKNKDLRIYADSSNKEEYITIKNFVAKDVTNNGNAKKGIEDTSSVMLEINGETYDLRNAIYDINGDSEKDYFYQIKTEKNYTGSWLNEEISASSLQKFDKKGNPLAYSSKGLSLNGGNGNDSIVGSRYSDTIKGGNGDDVIDGGLGNDNITGGAGENVINYTFGNGNDVINLTKGEILKLFIDGENIEYRAASNKKDLEIISTTEEGKLTLKNYYSKELGATVLINGDLDLAKVSTLDTITSANYFEVPSQKVKTSYTGSVLADSVDASGLSQAVGKNNKGVTIKTLAGNDVVKGSNFNDTITAGTGNNEFVYSFADGGDGKDVINLTKGETLRINLGSIDFENLEFTPASNKNDLVITYKDVEDSSITLKNYYSKELGATVLINGVDLSKESHFDIQGVTTTSAKGSALADNITAFDYKKDVDVIGKGTSINAGGGNDTIVGSKHNDTIKGGNGDDFIMGGTGNDKLYGEAGKNTFAFTVGDGKDTVYLGKGKDTISLNINNIKLDDIKQVMTSKGKGTKDAIITYGDKGDTVTIKDFYTIDKKGNITGYNPAIEKIETNTQQFFFSKKGEDTFELTKYGEGFEDRLHTTIVMGSDRVQDVLALNDELFYGNDGNFYFVKDGNDFKIWYNYDTSISTASVPSGVSTYDGSEINNINETVYTSSITLKDFFTVENPIDKFIINGEEYSIIKHYKNEIYLNNLVENGEFEEGGTFHATKWNDSIVAVNGSSDYGENVYGGAGDDYIWGWARRDSYYGEEGNDTIYINENGVLADGGVGDDTIIVDEATSSNPEGVRVIGGKGDDSLENNEDVKTTFEFALGDGTDTVTSTSGYDIIKFTDTDLANLSFKKDGNNIEITYGEDKVIVKDALTNLVKIMVEDKVGEQLNILEKFNIYVGDSIVSGTDGNDTVYGGDMSDTIIGKKGDDLLIGRKGSDTYEFNIGDGVDTVISGTDGVQDKLKFNNVENVREFEFNIADNEKDLVISYGDNDKVIVQNYFELGNTVTTWLDKDGISHNIATDNNHSINNTTDATVTGTIFNDYITVNAANTSISGGEGANTYVITADNVAHTITTTSGRDTIKFNTEIADLVFDVNGNDVTIKGTNVDITVKDYLLNIPELNIVNGNTSSKLIEKLESAGIIYSNESTFAGTDEAEQLIGGDSANIITSGEGDDVINAGKGNDTLVFAKGDGKDTIINGTEANEVDTIKFTDVTIDELTYKKDGDNLVIGYIDNDTDSVTVKDYYKSSNTVKKFIVKDENEVSGFKEYDIEKDLKNNIKGATTEISGTQYNDRIWGTDGDDTITDTQGVNELIGGNGADTYNFTSYGNGFADRRHDTIIMGADSVQDTIVFNDEDNNDINSGYFNFVREGNNLRIWYNLDSSLSDNENLVNYEVTIYNGSEVYKDWSSVYCSSLTIKDYFLSTAENCTIDKLVINDEEYSIFDIVSNSIDLDSLFDAGELEDGGTYHATRFNDYITTRRGVSDVGEIVYAGDGDDFIGTWGRRDSYYGEQGNDTIYINENGVLADGGNGDDEIFVESNQWDQNEDGVRVIGGKGNDTLTGYSNAHNGKTIYEFATGDGTDIINYKGGNDVIKFTDIDITDITFGHYDLVNKTLTLNYGTSDSLTINGLSTDRNTVKIEDSTGTKYTVLVGDGDYNNNTVQKPNVGENAVFISSTGRDYFEGNTGINVFASSNGYDGTSGETNGTNIFITTPEENASIYANGQNDKIILKDLALSELKYEFGIDGDGTVKITNTVNDQEINLFNFPSYKVNPTIVAKDGETTILDELSMIFPTGDTLVGTEGTDGNDILIGSDILDKVDTIVGGKGDDILFGDGGPDLYEFNNGDGNDVLGRYCGKEATFKFNDSTYEELNFTQLSGNKYQVTYNGGADSVIFYNDRVTKFIVKDGENYKEYSMDTDMIHKVTGDGVETNLVGSDINDVFTGTSIDETMTGGEGSNIYNFTTGGGTDTVVISSNTDTINFTGVKTGDLTFSLNGSDLEIAYGDGDDKVIVKDYAKTLPEVAITGADSTSTTAMEGFATTGATLVNGVGTGTVNADILIAGATDDTITGGKGDDTISGGTGNNTYIFNKGDGTDTINYATGTDVIKFNDVEIADITFGHYDLVNKTLTLNYGTSDSLTINGLSTDRNTVKIEDSTGTKYTVLVGDGDYNNNTVQKPNVGENAVFISSTGRDYFEGNTGINVFTNCNNVDVTSGSNTTNFYIINSETNASIYAHSDNDKIILKNLELSQLNYELIRDTGRVKITNTVNSQEVNLFNFTSNRVNPTIVDKNGNEVKVLEKVYVIFGDVGTSGNDTISANTNNGEVFGKGGNDLIYASGNYSTIYTYDKDLKNTTAGSSVTVDINGNQTITIYAQSEENIILNEGSRAKGTYYAYSDQKTSITEAENQTKSTDSVLNIMNTDDVNDVDGVHTNLNIVFNVSNGYKTTQGIYAIGDVRILDDNNFANWKKGASYKDITLKGNCVETINSSDGYSITSTQIAQLAESVAGWLTKNEFANVNEAMSGGTPEQIEALTAYFTNASNWTATV